MRQTVILTATLTVGLLLLHALVAPIPATGWTIFAISAGLCLIASTTAEMTIRRARPHAHR